MEIKKIITTTKALILSIIFIAIALLTLPKAFGYQIFAVTSGSMEPTFAIGSLVYVKPVDPQNIQVGDVITFTLWDANQGIATHRVTAVDQGQKFFTTKGDANNSPDIAPVTYDHLLGKVEFSIILLGYLSFFIKAKGAITALLLAACVLLAFVVMQIFKKTQPEQVANESSE